VNRRTLLLLTLMTCVAVGVTALAWAVRLRSGTNHEGEQKFEAGIHGDVDPKIKEVLLQYVNDQTHWDADEFCIDVKGPDPHDKELTIYMVTHRDDLRAAEPGGGKSMLLKVDEQAGRVVKELHFQ
jgi:hypothetical protein